MKKKICIAILVILLIIIGIVVFINSRKNKEDENAVQFTEYTPQEEISEEQLRQTLITLYFKNAETGMLMPEARLVDVKILLDNPYKVLVELLLEGPKNEKLVKTIPNDTKINSVEIKKDIVYIDFSEEFTKAGNIGAVEESKIINSIVNTLTELTEVNGVKILINGEENMQFEDGEINFKEVFVRTN